MRKLVRTNAPHVLIDPKGRAADEATRAEAFFSRDTIPDHETFEFEAYNHKDVKAALKEMSSNKCHYCECEAVAGNDGDIEHFRPKGEVYQDGITTTPGYFWLATEWTNLFLSCKHCNQARKHIDYNGKARTDGKMNQFPLSDQAKRLNSKRREIKDEEEFRWLIDPCADEPGRHLVFQEDGKIEAAKDTNGEEDPKGRHSIDVYALYRPNLTHERMHAAISLRAKLNGLQILFENHHKAEDSGNQAWIESSKMGLDMIVQSLKADFSLGQRYTEMSYQIISKFLAKYGIILERYPTAPTPPSHHSTTTSTTPEE